MGVDRKIAIFNIMTGFAFVMGMHWIWFIPVTLVVHVVMRYYHKKEPQLREVFMVFKRQGTHYDPWWHPYDKQYSGTAKHYHRDSGLGRDLPC